MNRTSPRGGRASCCLRPAFCFTSSIAAPSIAFGFLCFGSVGIQEYIERLMLWPDWLSGIRTGLEEGTELLGSFLVLCGIVDRRAAPDVAAGFARGGGVLPILGCLRHVPVILLVGLLLHLSIGVFAQANFDDMAKRGNPGSWYPAVVFVLLSIAAVDKGMQLPAKSRLFWQAAAAIFLMCSLGAVFARLPRWLLLNFYFVYAGVAALASIAVLSGWRRSRRHLLLLASMAAAVAAELLLAGAAMPHLILGVFAYFSWYFFMSEPAPAAAPVKVASPA